MFLYGNIFTLFFFPTRLFNVDAKKKQWKKKTRLWLIKSCFYYYYYYLPLFHVKLNKKKNVFANSIKSNQIKCRWRMWNIEKYEENKNRKIHSMSETEKNKFLSSDFRSKKKLTKIMNNDKEKIVQSSKIYYFFFFANIYQESINIIEWKNHTKQTSTQVIWCTFFFACLLSIKIVRYIQIINVIKWINSIKILVWSEQNLKKIQFWWWQSDYYIGKKKEHWHLIM